MQSVCAHCYRPLEPRRRRGASLLCEPCEQTRRRTMTSRRRTAQRNQAA